MKLAITLEEARELDATDPLAPLRAQFALPRARDGRELIYLCGHSLGLAPLSARARVNEELDSWEQLGVEGHHLGMRPWIDYGEASRPGLATLAGADPNEVMAMNSLSVNLHLLLASFYRPHHGRIRILIEAGAFPSDRHIVASQLAWHGYDPRSALIELAPRSGEDLLRQEDIEAAIESEAGHLALVLWPGVQYRSGQCFDLAAIARVAHRAGAMVGFDLAHSMGNVPLALHDSGADFAAWCSYKYLNAGPGAIGGAFVHARHAAASDLPRLAGWWGHDSATRFLMGPEFLAMSGAAGWQVSNPPIFSSAPLLASLDIFAAAGMSALRAKSLSLTASFENLLLRNCGAAIEILTPADIEQRGCQLSVRLRCDPNQARENFARLTAQGVVADWREPDTIRMSPVPLYNRFEDVYHAAARLGEILR